MKRHVPGLSDTAGDSRPEIPDGIYLVRVDQAQHRWQAQKHFYVLRLSVLEPKPFAGRSIVSRLYCTPKAMWKLGWFLRDFLYDPELLSQDEIDERALRGLIGVVKISHTVVNGISLVNFDGFAPASQWEELSTAIPSCRLATVRARGRKGHRDELQLHPDLPVPDLSSPLSPSLSRWLAGERFRAAMLFGRCFEQAVAALFRHEDPAAVLFEQWAPCKDLELVYSGNDTWDHMFQQGIQLLERFIQDGRVQIHQPQSHQQVRFTRTLSSGKVLSPSSMLSANWTAHPVCWSGRPPPPAIPRSRTALLLWIRSWSAIPG